MCLPQRGVKAVGGLDKWDASQQAPRVVGDGEGGRGCYRVLGGKEGTPQTVAVSPSQDNASKLLLGLMESRHDSENAERILISLRPQELVGWAREVGRWGVGVWG